MRKALRTDARTHTRTEPLLELLVAAKNLANGKIIGYHHAGGTSKQRRKERRAAERNAAAKAESDEKIKVDSKASEEAAKQKSPGKVDLEDKEIGLEAKAKKDEKHSCDLCERNFESLKGLQIHICEHHGQR